ncbi:hypothetical protein RJ55_07769 [Drechmeria coniospora]|nr:hypothetical protein RJ55_07769 [Drechmeria coniospora]
MPAFQSKKFRPSGEHTVGSRYRALMNRRPFLTFGLPFIAVIIAGSFVLTPATAIRYERHDRKVRQLTKDEELGVRRSARRVNMKDDGSPGETSTTGSRSAWSDCRARATASCGDGSVGSAAKLDKVIGGEVIGGEARQGHWRRSSTRSSAAKLDKVIGGEARQGHRRRSSTRSLAAKLDKVIGGEARQGHRRPSCLTCDGGRWAA